MPTVLIIGASRGIGLELARQYYDEDWTVHATVRDPSADSLPATFRDRATLHSLEVTDRSHLNALAAALSETAFDVLIHNAGVFGKGMAREDVLAINAEAPIRTAEKLLPCVLQSDEKKLVLVTSQMGSRGGKTGSLGVYGDSKAALNDAFRECEPVWREKGATSIVLHPGWVRTDMGGPNASVSVGDSASGIRKVIAALTPEQSGQFLTWQGREHPW